MAYGAPELLRRALEPVAGLPIVVIDNSSLAAVRAVCDGLDVPYVDASANLGFAAGANLGVQDLWRKHGRVDVLLLNPDAVLTPADVRTLQVALHRDARTAAVAPALEGADGPQRAAWPFPAPGRMWREAFGLLGTSRHQADWLVGAALLLNARAIEEIGPFDERFFLYGEETDWQRRAVLAGMAVRLVPEVTVEHVGAGTSGDLRRREALFHAGQETYIRKWAGALGWQSYRAAALVAAVIRSPLPGARGASARLRVGLYARGPRRVAGLT